MTRRKTGRGPGRPPRAEGDRASSRERLIEAAAKVFAARGYSGATVDLVLAEAGLSKGTFYWNFDSKEELFLALIEERIERPLLVLLEFVRATPSATAMGPTISSGFTALVSQQRDLVLLIHEFWGVAVRDEELRDRYVERQAAMLEVLAQTLASRHEGSGVEPTLPLDQLALAFTALAQGLALQIAMDPDAVPEGLVGEIGGLIWDGFVLRAQRREQGES